MTTKLFTSVFIYALLLLGAEGQATRYTPYGQKCNYWYEGAGYSTSVADHPNVIHVDTATESNEYSCLNWCRNTQHSDSVFTSLTYANNLCSCYFTKPVQSTALTTDGDVLTLWTLNSGSQLFIECPDSQSLGSSKCAGEVFHNVGNSLLCEDKCMEDTSCRVFSYNHQNDICYLCDNSYSTYNNLYSMKELIVSPNCAGTPGAGSNGEWYFENGYLFSASGFNKGVYEDKVELICNDGYTLSGIGVSDYMCNWDGQWQTQIVNNVPANSANCVPMECPVTFGQGVSSDCGDSLSFGDACTATCDEGYIGESADFSCTLASNGDVVLSGSITCEPTVCALDFTATTYEGVYSGSCGPQLDVYESCDIGCDPYYMPTQFSFVGEGFCRPAGCEITSSDCKVNGYRKNSGSTDEECRAQCEADDDCVGYAFSSAESAETPTRCYVYTSDPDSVVPYMWTDYTKNHFNIATFKEEAGVVCYKVQDKYNWVGSGWCRDNAGNVVSGYYQDESNELACRAACDMEANCEGYAISSSEFNYPNRCQVYLTQFTETIPDGWTYNDGESFQISSSNGYNNVECYEVVDASGPQGSVSCNWGGDSAFATSNLECVCQEPESTFVSANLVNSAQSSTLDDGQIHIHVRFPQYLENIVLKFDSIDGDVAYEEGNEGLVEDWEVTDAACSTTVERSFGYSELSSQASLFVEESQLSFTLYFTATESFVSAEGVSITRQVQKPLTFTVELATSIELSLQLSLHSPLEAIVAIEFNIPMSELQGTDEEIMASVEADLDQYSVTVLKVQGSDVLGGFRRALSAAEPNAVVVIAGSQVDVDETVTALQSGDATLEIMDSAQVLSTTDYTQLVEVTTEYSDVTNNDASSTATIHFSTTINEPWEFTGQYSMKDFTGTSHSLEEIADANSCKTNGVVGDHICEQSWTLVVEIPAEEACQTAETSFTITLESAHGEEVMETAPISFSFDVAPNTEQCEQLTGLGDVSNVDGLVKLWNGVSETFEANPTWDIYVDDEVKFQADFTSELATLASVTLVTIQASQDETLCSDCLSEFEQELAFSCSTCADGTIVSEGNSIEFSMFLSSSVFSGSNGVGKDTELVFAFDLTYSQGAGQRRLLKMISRRSLAAASAEESHVSSVQLALLATPPQADKQLSSGLFTNLLLVMASLLFTLAVGQVYSRAFSTKPETEEEKYERIAIENAL